MPSKPKIENLLVVLSPDLVRPAEPLESPLLRRAMSLSERTGCTLELFHVCHDSSLDDGVFTSDENLESERRRLTDRAATRLEELAATLENEGASVQYSVCWDSPRTDAILRKIARSNPDMVMKQAREHSYVLGLTTNTDWELARRSPANLWLVSDSTRHIDRVVAAIGNKLGDPSDVTTAADYDLLRAAGLLQDIYDAEIYPVNAYQPPMTHTFVSSIGATPVTATTGTQEEAQMKAVQRHFAAVRALAQYCNLPRENVHVLEGHPSDVIPQIVEELKANLIVMGARSFGRLERFVSSVTVEPVMSETDSDILIVRERDFSMVPRTAKSPLRGVPRYDVEHAVTHPESCFESPQQVANLDEFSIELRRRILQAWEYDIRAEMADENEGGPARKIDVNALDAIFAANELLNIKQCGSGDEPATLERQSA